MAKIFVVDDSWLTRTSLRSMLEGGGYEVVEAENGNDAIETIPLENPDCILLDLLMPGMTGFDVLAELKTRELSTPVIVVTADIQDTVREKCLGLGAFGFLNKPPNENELMQTIQQALADKDDTK